MKIKYYKESEVEEIVAQQKVDGYELIEIQNITDGNFLIFAKIEPLQPTETEILTDYIIDVDYRVTMIELGL